MTLPRDPDKHANRCLTRVLLTAAVKGADANNFDMTIGKLLKDPDTFYLETPIQAKAYDVQIREDLMVLKKIIMGNADVRGCYSFEL